MLRLLAAYLLPSLSLIPLCLSKLLITLVLPYLFRYYQHPNNGRCYVAQIYHTTWNYTGHFISIFTVHLLTNFTGNIFLASPWKIQLVIIGLGIPKSYLFQVFLIYFSLLGSKDIILRNLLYTWGSILKIYVYVEHYDIQ